MDIKDRRAALRTTLAIINAGSLGFGPAHVAQPDYDKADEQIQALTKAGVVFKVEGEELEWHKSSHWDSLSGDVYYGCQREMKAQGYTLTAPLTGGE